MSFLYIGTLGELIIIELFVLWIWIRVLLDTIRDKKVVSVTTQTSYNKLFITSMGLVCNALAIAGIMVIRYLEMSVPNMPTLGALVVFYVLLAIGNFMFILSAAIGSNMKLVKVFIVITICWTAMLGYIGFN